ncbi:MAG: hypothetical protein HYU99_10750, partial [Deltaproteobacteria bacterium]|nr:hypothetical protein [Deltaproteobacteria bacterium]
MKKVDSLAEAFLKKFGLNRMAQLALAQRDRRINVAGIAAGQGANYIEELNAWVDGKDPQGNLRTPQAVALYEALKPTLQNSGIDPDAVRELNPESDELPINEIRTSMPMVDLLQILADRQMEASGYVSHRNVANSGQSAGLIRGFGMSRAYRTTGEQPLIPAGVAGLRPLEELEREVRLAVVEGAWYQEDVPYMKSEGAVPVLNISGIPLSEEDSANSPLGKIIEMINRHAENGDHLNMSNVNTLEPDYFVLMAGTTNALIALELIICAFINEKPSGKISPDARRLASAVRDEASPIFAGISRERVRAPQRGLEELGMTIPAHDAVLLDHAATQFVRQIKGMGLGMVQPVTSVILNSTGHDVLQLGSADITEVHADEQYRQPVWLVKIARGLADRGAHVVIDYGPTDFLGRSSLPANHIGIPVVSVASKRGFEILTSTDPIQVQSELAPANGIGAVYLPDGGTLKVDSSGTVKVRPPKSAPAPKSGFEGISGVAVSGDNLGDEKTRISVTAATALNEADQARFREAFYGLVSGPIRALCGEARLHPERHPEGEGNPNPYYVLMQPRTGFTYEWVVGNGTIQGFKLYETSASLGRRLALEVEERGGDTIVTREYLETRNGRSILERNYRVHWSIEKPVNGASPAPVARLVDLNGDAAFRQRAREAYRTDWGADTIPGARELLQTPPSPDFLQKFSLEYTYNATTADMVDYAKTVGSTNPLHTNPNRTGGVKAHPGYLKDRVMGKGMLVPLLAEALGLDPTTIRNLGGLEWVNPNIPVSAGRIAVKTSLVRVEDVNERPLQGRRVTAYIEARNERGEILAKGIPTIISLGENDVAPGEVRPVFAPRTDLPTSIDFLEGRKIHPLPTPQVVATGKVMVPLNAAGIFTDDENRIHTSDVSAVLAGLDDGRIMQGEVYFDRVNEAIVAKNTRGDTSRYVGFANRKFGVPVKPGETLSYTVVRNRHAQGLHEYAVTLTNADGDEVAGYTLYDRAAQRLFMWTGQGSLEEGLGDLVRQDESRRAHFDRMQALVRDAGYPLDLTAAL